MLIKRILGTKCKIKRTRKKGKQSCWISTNSEVLMHEKWENSRICIHKNKNIKTKDMERKNP
jgi:hypothetical protein